MGKVAKKGGGASIVEPSCISPLQKLSCSSCNFSRGAQNAACLLDNRIRWKCQYVVNVDQNSDKKYQGKSRTFSFKIILMYN